MRTRACIVVIGRELYSHVGDDGTDFDGFENANEVRLAHFDLLLALYCLLLAGCWLLLAGCCLLPTANVPRANRASTDAQQLAAFRCGGL